MATQDDPAAVTIQDHGPGDIGLIIHRHGKLYADEFGVDERFEALVAKIGTDFLNHRDPSRERCWVAKRHNGEFLGCVMLVRDHQVEGAAKLRLLLVESSARGLGLGTRLVRQAIEFARQAGYSQVLLWTQSVLLGARHIYQREGFELVQSKDHATFGVAWTGEEWRLRL
jgi:GNAT superfamily N-acetyltransferase